MYAALVQRAFPNFDKVALSFLELQRPTSVPSRRGAVGAPTFSMPLGKRRSRLELRHPIQATRSRCNLKRSRVRLCVPRENYR